MQLWLNGSLFLFSVSLCLSLSLFLYVAVATGSTTHGLVNVIQIERGMFCMRASTLLIA